MLSNQLHTEIGSVKCFDLKIKILEYSQLLLSMENHCQKAVIYILES